MIASTLAHDFLTAAEQGQLELLKSCLEKGVDINITNRQGRMWGGDQSCTI